jgi:hypothetical protein
MDNAVGPRLQQRTTIVARHCACAGQGKQPRAQGPAFDWALGAEAGPRGLRDEGIGLLFILGRPVTANSLG